MAADYPSRVDIIPWGGWFDASQAMNRLSTGTALDLGRLMFTSPVQNAFIEWKVFLKAGTWNLKLLLNPANDRGIQTWTLGGVTLGALDAYFGVNTLNTAAAINGFTVATSGVYALRCTMATKNPSSSGYQMALHHITLQRTGA